jgi:uncharacterized membrane protein YdjX (TVP38/TMEM64 family)
MDTGLTPRHIAFSIANLVLILGGLYALFSYFGLTDVQNAVANSGIWAPLILIAAKASTIIIAPIGGAPLYPLGGALFGFWYGSALLILGDALGSAVAFYLSRFLGRSIAEKMMGEEKHFLSRALKMMGTVKGFFLARLCFLPAPEITSYGAGLTRLHFIPFIFISASLGVLPVLVLAKAGDLIALGYWWAAPLIFILFGLAMSTGLFIFRSLIEEEVSS